MISSFMHAHKGTIPSLLYGVGFPIFPPVSSADCNISMSSTITTILEECKNKAKGDYWQKTNKNKGKDGKERTNASTYLPSANVLVVVLFTLHTQLVTRRFSSGRLFNCVASRKAINTNTHIQMFPCTPSKQIRLSCKSSTTL